MKMIYYILVALTLGIVLSSGCIQQEKGSTIVPDTTKPVTSNDEIKGLPEQTNTAQPPPISWIDYSHEYPASAANVDGFEMKKTGSGFVVYYHPGGETNANKVLAVLEQGGLNLYKKYFGFEPKDIPVYLAVSVDEYVKIADFPGGKENVAVGDGSAPNGKIYLYKPFGETIQGKTGGVIIHEGVHAAAYQFFGQDKMRYLPGFLNEGMAYYLEYTFKAGPKFDPLDQIYHSDLLIDSIETGSPKLLSLEELAQKCDGYISDETLNFLCRGQGTFTVWYINENYGEGALEKFLTNLKQTQNWQEALSSVTGKTTSQSGQEIDDSLKLMVERRRR